MLVCVPSYLPCPTLHRADADARSGLLLPDDSAARRSLRPAGARCHPRLGDLCVAISLFPRAVLM